MSNGAFQPLPPNGRLISAGMAGAAALGLLMNHSMIESQNVAKLMVLCFGPMAFFLGVGGMVEPKIVWSVGKYGKHLPVIYKLIGGALGALGVAVTIFLLLFVYRLGPPEPKNLPRLPKREATEAKPNSEQPIASSKPERRVAPQEVMYLTYARPRKRWEKMDEAAVRGVRRDDSEGVTTLQYTEGEHALLKVLWPDVLAVGDRFTVELQGANSVEMVDLEGTDANARTSLPVSDKLVVVATCTRRTSSRPSANAIQRSCGPTWRSATIRPAGAIWRTSPSRPARRSRRPRPNRSKTAPAAGTNC